jgi:hypothetical protein
LELIDSEVLNNGLGAAKPFQGGGVYVAQGGDFEPLVPALIALAVITASAKSATVVGLPPTDNPNF